MGTMRVYFSVMERLPSVNESRTGSGRVSGTDNNFKARERR
jgi:hypothetical protein